MAGTLYLIPVSLGDAPWNAYLPSHTRDITCGLDHFIVENAKSARAELKRIAHPRPLRELHIAELPQQPDVTAIDELLLPLRSGFDLGLMSEAGCPGVADPGALLVRRAHELGIRSAPLVGPSALLLGLMASGLDGQRFAFHGYLPAREPERGRRIGVLEAESARLRQTQLFIETPYRNPALFQALITKCRPDTLLCTAIDLTLTSEEIHTLSIDRWRRQPAPRLERRPTVFLLLSAA